MWDLIVLVPDHCLSFYYSPRRPMETLIKIFVLFAHQFRLAYSQTGPSLVYITIPDVR